MAEPVALKHLVRIEGGDAPFVRLDRLAAEEPLEIRIAGRSLAVVMRTPGHDRELAAGFLWSEGIIRSREEVLDLVHCAAPGEPPNPNLIDVLPASPERIPWDRLARNVFTSSSCGICSKASIEAVHQNFPPIAGSPRLSREVLFSLPEKLRAAQETFEKTGGLHASALFDLSGHRVALREDVGRHNALDKLIGRGFFSEDLPYSERILMVSGRISFEIMQKALSARIPAVAAISAPTSLAVEFAEASGQILIGFLRGRGMNVYCGAESVE